jgi:hypothetical protein
MVTRPLWMIALAGGLLTACGGSSDEPPVAGEERVVPTSATASPTAYTDYVATRPLEDALEPLVVQAVVPPVSDVDEPLPLR